MQLSLLQPSHQTCAISCRAVLTRDVNPFSSLHQFLPFLFAPLPALYNLLDSVCYFHYLHVICLLFHSVSSLCIPNHSNLFLILNENQNSCFSNTYDGPRFVLGSSGYFEKYICSLPTIEYKT